MHVVPTFTCLRIVPTMPIVSIALIEARVRQMAIVWEQRSRGRVDPWVEHSRDALRVRCDV
jgi:hypothetical protein